jgi:hypothetical protein
MTIRILAAATCLVAFTACTADIDTAPPGPKLTLSASGTERGGALGESAALSADVALPGRFAAPVFDVDAALSAASLPSAALGYRSVADVSAATVEALAAAFGLTGTATDGRYGFSIEHVDADDRYSSLYVDRFGGWWYSSYLPQWGCVEPGSPPDFGDGSVTEESDRSAMSCVEPQPAGATITEDAARAAAAAIFAAAGHRNLPVAVTVIPDDGYGETVHVRVIETVGGYKTGRVFEVGFSDGTLAWASGTVAELVEIGAYDLIAADAVPDRLADYRYATWGSYEPQDWLQATASMAAVDATSTIEPGSVAEPGSGDGQVTVGEYKTSDNTDMLGEPAIEEAGTFVVTLDTVEVVLGVFYQNEDVYYLPSFHLTGPTGWVQTVLAVVDGAVEFTDPEFDDQAPGRPFETPVTLADAGLDDIIGLDEQVAAERIEAAGLSVRVIDRDGEPFLATADYRTDRVNLSIVGGVVIAASVG